MEFESFNDFLKQFHSLFYWISFFEDLYLVYSLAISSDDRSTLSDDDEGISSDDLDDEDISRKAIHRALMVRFSYFHFTEIKSLSKII